MTPALAFAEVERLQWNVDIISWRVVELWMFVVVHFGPGAW